MRIISDHHDYYDCIQAQGQDEDCVWVRRLEEVNFSKYNPWPFPELLGSSYYSFSRDKLFAKSHIIGFCGKIYPVIELSKVPIIALMLNEKKSEFFHNIEDIDAYIESNYRQQEIDAYHYHYNKWDKKISRNGIGWHRKGFNKFLNECKENQDKFSKFFTESRTPVFTAHQSRTVIGAFNRSDKSIGRIIYHGRGHREEDEEYSVIKQSDNDVPMLKNLKFFKIFDTQSAFQNIHMYIGGVLGFNNPYVPEMDDEVKRDSHGFDKMSFKKEPSKK